MSDTYATRAALHEQFVDGYGAVRVLPLDARLDGPVIHGWVNADRAAFWGMRDLAEDQVIAIYAHMETLDTHHAHLLVKDGEPVALLQTYEPAADRVGACYPVEPGDIGVHLLMALSRTRRRASRLDHGTAERGGVVRPAGPGPRPRRGRPRRTQREGHRPLPPPGLHPGPGGRSAGGRPSRRPPPREACPTRLPRPGDGVPGQGGGTGRFGGRHGACLPVGPATRRWLRPAPPGDGPLTTSSGPTWLSPARPGGGQPCRVSRVSRNASAGHFRQASVTSTGSFLMPLTKLDRTRGASPASLMSVILGISSSNMMRISVRASRLPRHRCGLPLPKVM